MSTPTRSDRKRPLDAPNNASKDDEAPVKRFRSQDSAEATEPAEPSGAAEATGPTEAAGSTTEGDTEEVIKLCSAEDYPAWSKQMKKRLQAKGLSEAIIIQRLNVLMGGSYGQYLAEYQKFRAVQYQAFAEIILSTSPTVADYLICSTPPKCTDKAFFAWVLLANKFTSGAANVDDLLSRIEKFVSAKYDPNEGVRKFASRLGGMNAAIAGAPNGYATVEGIMASHLMSAMPEYLQPAVNEYCNSAATITFPTLVDALSEAEAKLKSQSQHPGSYQPYRPQGQG
ncbi:hypothetical protein Dda_9252 [Drechslerella dactyloides]|uniref:Gag protein n=1 Tax=Drechslerella dactyloides TaxID=74499 RepID=A0AAD6IR14_DREDA|nr:hypothetical protein Dda_9252 [Drechslerella dactyloides]